MAIFDYNPSAITPFPYWRWNKVLPAVYDDSLSQYELLSKLLSVVNNIIESTNTTGEQVEALTQLVQQLIDGEFPSGLVQYVDDLIDAAMADEISTINSIINEMKQELYDGIAINVLFPPSGLTPCVNDGITDNTAALQDMINYLDSGYGGKIYFPCGAYLFEDSITVTHDKISFVGENSRGTRLNYIGTSNFFNVNGYSNSIVGGTNNNENVRFSNLSVVGKSDGSSNCAFNVIDQLRFTLYSVICIYFNYMVDFSVSNLSSAGSSKIENCTYVAGVSKNSGSAAMINSHSGINSIYVTKCGGQFSGARFINAVDSTDYFIDMANTANTGDVACRIISTESLSNNSGCDFRITNSVFDSLNGMAIQVVNYDVWGCLIADNWLNRKPSTSNDATPYIALSGVDYCKVINNHFGGSINPRNVVYSNNLVRGIALTNCNNCVIANNTFQDVRVGIVDGESGENTGKNIISSNSINLFGSNCTGVQSVQTLPDTICGNIITCHDSDSNVANSINATSSIGIGNVTPTNPNINTTSGNLVS